MFLVLSASTIEGSRAFYQRLGMVFDLEKHGDGPQHYSMVVEDMLFELYPTLKSNDGKQLFLGFHVQGEPEALKQELISRYGGTEPTPIIPTTKSGIATLCDPSGILVKLFPQS